MPQKKAAANRAIVMAAVLCPCIAVTMTAATATTPMATSATGHSRREPLRDVVAGEVERLRGAATPSGGSIEYTFLCDGP
jgi:hypothetical protein